MRALESRFKSPEWALFREVGDSTGFRVKRHADAVAMGIWPSRGLEIVGIECKVSRSDWLAEKKNPAKAEPVMQYCDRWYLAVGDASIVLDGELPPTWGLLVLERGRLVQKVEAPKLEPKPISRAFVAALLRRAADASPAKAELEAAKKAGHDEGYESGLAHQKNQSKYDARALENLRETVANFKKATGIELSEYGGNERTGELVQLLDGITSGDGSHSKMNAILSEVRSVREHADKLEDAARRMIGVLHPAHERALVGSGGGAGGGSPGIGEGRAS